MFRNQSGKPLPTLQRAVNLSLEFVTKSKRRRLTALEAAFRGCVNRFVEYFWDNPDARDDAASKDAASAGRLPLTLRNKARQLAFETARDTRKTENETGSVASRPTYTGGLKMRELVNVTLRDVPHDGSALDVIVDLPSLVVGEHLVLMTKATAPLMKWLSQPGARFCHCVEIHGDRMTVVVEMPSPPLKADGEVLGVDAGINKFLSTSRGEFFGTDFKAVIAKVRRRKPGSKARARARRERDQAVNRALNQLQWDAIRAVAFEDLRGIKRGKKRGTRAFRRSRNAWVARQVATRGKHKAAEHGVWAVSVNPSWSSLDCHVCGSRGARQGAVFACEKCGLVDDADHNAAVNIKKRGEAALERIEATLRFKALAKKPNKKLAAKAAKSKKLVQAAGVVPQARKSNAPTSGPKGSEQQRRSKKASATGGAGHAGDLRQDSRSDGRRTASATTRRKRAEGTSGDVVKETRVRQTSESPRRVGSLGRKTASKRRA